MNKEDVITWKLEVETIVRYAGVEENKQCPQVIERIVRRDGEIVYKDYKLVRNRLDSLGSAVDEFENAFTWKSNKLSKQGKPSNEGGGDGRNFISRFKVFWLGLFKKPNRLSQFRNCTHKAPLVNEKGQPISQLP
ncbi:MAG: hypothetical protein K2X37_11905 [Chitinophagaceae bacterium]|nr:hypothetical protein [Chitinophagaceae bacterium]